MAANLLKTWHLTVIERAFELARTGDYSEITQIKKRLLAEGYETAQITGPVLLRQLREACRAAAADHPPERV